MRPPVHTWVSTGLSFLDKGLIMFNKIIIAASLALVSSVAAAADVPAKFYVGADLGTTKFEDESDRESGFGIFGGYQFTKNIAVEVGVRRLASIDAEFEGMHGSSRLNQYSVSAIGTIPFDNGFSVFGRLGANRISVNAKVAGDSFSDHANRGVYGVGVAYSFTPAISARLELQKPMKEMTNLSAGVVYKF
jgi:OOP family OmpA-OmpF porin